MPKIITYNVNGIRSALNKGLLAYLQQEEADVVCLQEIKALETDFDHAPFAALGYQVFCHPAIKKGYSGVAILSRHQPERVVTGCGMQQYDCEGRVLQLDFAHLPSVMSVYMPSGTTGGVRQDFKYEWLADFLPYAKEKAQAADSNGLVVCGDFNIAHTEKDIKNAKANQNSSGFLPEERAWMTSYLQAGFTDAFRHLHPENEEYSWWSFRAGSRERNIGWRIDYQTLTTSLQGRVVQAFHRPEARHSDHCPVGLVLAG